jgi:small conductance mechanosensitive channel
MDEINALLKNHTGKIIFIILFAIIVHILVLLIRLIDNSFISKLTTKRPKWNSIRTLGFSILIFTVYFVALGKILQELGISLTAYVASASVIGLAVGFGTQGVVQDVITGITLVFSDLVDVGELVEVNGVTGVVRSINMRFIEIEDHLGTKAFIPNRTITKVVNYPKGYISCSVDFLNTPEMLETPQSFKEIDNLLHSMKEQYQGVFRGPISMYNNKETSVGKKYTRVKLRIWPGRGTLIENTLKQELLAILKQNSPDYKDWMLSINYEVENGKHTKSKKKKPDNTTLV